MSAREATVCSEIRGHLPLFVGGDLEVALIAGVRRHLDGCPACRAELERAASAREVLHSLARDESEAPEVDLWPAIRAELRAVLAAPGSATNSAPAAPSSGPRRRPIARTAARWLPLAAAAGLAGVLWVGFGGNGGEGEPGAGRAAPDASSSPLAATPQAERSGGAPLSPVIPTTGGVGGAAPVAGGLRRAGPEAERLADRALWYPLAPLADDPVPGSPPGLRGNRPRNSLASDRELR